MSLKTKLVVFNEITQAGLCYDKATEKHVQIIKLS